MCYFGQTDILSVLCLSLYWIVYAKLLKIGHNLWLHEEPLTWKLSIAQNILYNGKKVI